LICALDALARLREGNRRFVQHQLSAFATLNPARRAALLDGQEPFAIVLGCSDSLPFAPVLTGSVGPKEHFLFSPDNKHIAWFGNVPSANAWGVHIDGKFLPVGGKMIYTPTFTPDSQHLWWMGKALNEPKYVIYLDGEEVMKTDFLNDIVNHPFWWQVGSDGILTAAIVDQGSVKRIRITPGTETSVETMLSAATKPR
jgi:hypothetical protein